MRAVLARHDDVMRQLREMIARYDERIRAERSREAGEPT
jgi:hypothetical protein